MFSLQLREEVKCNKFIRRIHKLLKGENDDFVIQNLVEITKEKGS